MGRETPQWIRRLLSVSVPNQPTERVVEVVDLDTEQQATDVRLPADVEWYPGECSVCTREAARVCDDAVCRSSKLGHTLGCSGDPHSGDCMDQEASNG